MNKLQLIDLIKSANKRQRALVEVFAETDFEVPGMQVITDHGRALESLAVLVLGVHPSAFDLHEEDEKEVAELKNVFTLELSEPAEPVEGETVDGH